MDVCRKVCLPERSISLAGPPVAAFRTAELGSSEGGSERNTATTDDRPPVYSISAARVRASFRHRDANAVHGLPAPSPAPSSTRLNTVSDLLRCTHSLSAASTPTPSTHAADSSCDLPAPPDGSYDREALLTTIAKLRESRGWLEPMAADPPPRLLPTASPGVLVECRDSPTSPATTCAGTTTGGSPSASSTSGVGSSNDSANALNLALADLARASSASASQAHLHSSRPRAQPRLSAARLEEARLGRLRAELRRARAQPSPSPPPALYTATLDTGLL